jgi:hypothetical protein
MMKTRRRDVPLESITGHVPPAHLATWALLGLAAWATLLGPALLL